MALFLTDAVLSILDAADILLQQRSDIGGITVDTTIEEAYSDSIDITDHPVEVGAQITDHSYKRPMSVILRCGWSDSNPQAQLGAAFSGGSFTGGAMAASDYIAGIYSQLLDLQESRQTFQLTTGMRVYDSVLIHDLYVHRDQRTRFALSVEASLRQIILVSTQSATLPPQANQKTPASTAEVVNGGAQSLQPASPAPGGSLPPSLWTAGP